MSHFLRRCFLVGVRLQTGHNAKSSESERVISFNIYTRAPLPAYNGLGYDAPPKRQDLAVVRKTNAAMKAAVARQRNLRVKECIGKGQSVQHMSKMCFETAGVP